MTDDNLLSYVINDMIELNLSYMPFIERGGLFIPTQTSYPLGASLIIELQLPGKKDVLKIEGKVIWVTPKNALHHVIPGVGIQFIGPTADTVRAQIESHVDKNMELGGYTYGIMDEQKK